MSGSVADLLAVRSGMKVKFVHKFPRFLWSFVAAFIICLSWEYIVNGPKAASQLARIEQELGKLRPANSSRQGSHRVSKPEWASVGDRYAAVATCSAMLSYYDLEMVRNTWHYVEEYATDTGTVKRYRKGTYYADIECRPDVAGSLYSVDLTWRGAAGGLVGLAMFLVLTMVIWLLSMLLTKRPTRGSPRGPIRGASVLLFLVAVTAQAGDFCSLTVRVANAGGYKPTGLSVTLVESNGRTETGTTKDGEIRFCDLGISPITLTIGERDRCNEVVVRNVAMNWDTERVVDVIYDRGYCNGDELQTVGCLTVVRFVNELGQAVGHVRFEPPVGRSRSVQSDLYGRALVALKPGEALSFGGSAPGYLPGRVELQCGTTTLKKEVIITLRGVK